MLVVLLIGLIYGLAINSIEKAGKPEEKLTLKTLVEFMQTQQQSNDISLICTDRCNSCVLYADGEAVKEIEPFVDSSAEFHRFDHFIGSEPIEWAPLYDEEGREEEVCFRYDLYRDGSRSELLAEYRGETIDFGGPFSTTAVYASLADAVEARQMHNEEIVR